MILYVDTSAAMKLVVEEPESAALADRLQLVRTSGAATLVSSLLLHAELRCAANRRPEEVPSETVRKVLSTIVLVDVESSDLVTGPLLPGRLRSADAIHLATALRVDARTMLVYVAELAAAAATAGLEVLCPA